MEIKRREGETINAFLYRFNKRVRQAGILQEAKKRRFRSRPVSKRQRKLAALYRDKKQAEVRKMKKLGTL